MEHATLARPYAKAAFQYASQYSKLSEWQEWLNVLANALDKPSIKHCLSHPGLPRDALAESLIAATGLGDDDKRANFTRLLVERQRLIILPAIVAIFNQLKAAQEQIIAVQLKTVSPVVETLKQKLLNALKIRLGCQVILEHKIDPSLIGGALVRAGDLVIDGSIRGKLQKLQEQLLKQ